MCEYNMEVSEDFSITLKIGLHTLSITVKRKDEEVYRAAEREINKRLNTLAARYPNQGNEMYLCMTALDIALSLKRNEQNNDTQPFVESMQRMLQGVEEALATTSR